MTAKSFQAPGMLSEWRGQPIAQLDIVLKISLCPLLICTVGCHLSRTLLCQQSSAGKLSEKLKEQHLSHVGDKFG